MSTDITFSKTSVRKTFFKLIKLNNMSKRDVGLWGPTDCKPDEKLAIIVPYRNRDVHSRLFVKHMHEFLRRQKLMFTIFVINQRMWSILLVTSMSALSDSAGTLSGSSALPLLIFLVTVMISSIVGGPTSIERSVGAASILGGFSGVGRFKNSLKRSTHMFRCSSMLVNTLPSLLFTGRSGLRLIYPENFGGVIAISRQQFEKVGGFSNVYFGWGGEDDDFYKRIIYHNYSIVRYPEEIARYIMLRHERDSLNEPNQRRCVGILFVG
ncbi:unnamed protein product [Schistosoma mattheei]|uniref:Glyco_transf_7C domain-containing protein n=1 Tax=Schistosoma mattheei TaxID=31246 RepID=A0A3P8JU11_9TREM|nr:unnamed protein product [Schistosoma mattheei]